MKTIDGCFVLLGLIMAALAVIVIGFLLRIGWQLVDHVEPLTNWLGQ